MADVHARPPNSILAMRSGFANGRYELRHATILDLIRTAWDVPAAKVWGGPSWLEVDRFDVVGMAPAETRRETLRIMLREVLAERFGLEVQLAARDLSACGIVPDKKHLLKVSEEQQDSGCRLKGAGAATPRTNPGEFVEVSCTHVSMEQFAAQLPGLRGAAGYVFGYPIVDRTGLRSNWAFNLHWTMKASRMQHPAEGSLPD